MTPQLKLPVAVEACLFDLDGVLTRTAELHAAAWKQMFDAFLVARAAGSAGSTAPFDVRADYERYVDGRPRIDGVRAFLRSRGIELPEGAPSDSATDDTVHGLGRRKNDLVHQLMREKGVAAYPGSVRFMAAVRAARLRRALVTSSENADAVLKAAGFHGEFEAVVDGRVAYELGLNGKPAPDAFLEAARRLDVEPVRCAVFEDALAGVAAGRAGRFGLVVGVNRAGHAYALRDAGADVVVRDLDDLLVL